MNRRNCLLTLLALFAATMVCHDYQSHPHPQEYDSVT